MIRTIWERHKLILLVIGALVFRLAISGLTAHSDLRVQTEWGKWMYDNHTFKGLYDWNVWSCIWPNHPPVISALYWWSYQLHSQAMWLLSSLGNFIALHRLAPTKFMWLYRFIIWFGQARYENTIFPLGVMVTIKQFMIAADMLVAGGIYLLAKRNRTSPARYVLGYLWLPFSWYLSAIWGQSDQLALLFLGLAWVLVWSKYPIFSILALGLSINLKPSGVILMPIYFWAFWLTKDKWKQFAGGGILVVGLSLWVASWFTSQEPWRFVIGELMTKLLTTGESLTTSNALNGWYILHPSPSVIVYSSTKYLGIAAENWGNLLYLLVLGLAIKIIKKGRRESLMAAVFVAGFGGWLLMTEMHERYAFFGLVFLLFYSIYKPRYYKYFVVLSLIYFVNLFWVFSYPGQLAVIKQVFEWGKQIIPRTMALANLLIWLKLAFQMKNES